MIVMVVAACEVVAGLGLIVAMYRRQIPLDVDETRGARVRGQRAARGASRARASVTTWGWLILAFPLAGS